MLSQCNDILCTYVVVLKYMTVIFRSAKSIRVRGHMLMLLVVTVEVLEFKVQQERVVSDDLRTSLEAEKSHRHELTGQLSEERTSDSRLQTELSDMTSRVTMLQDALTREQARLASTS